jgi:hypothetical protein
MYTYTVSSDNFGGRGGLCSTVYVVTTYLRSTVSTYLRSNYLSTALHVPKSNIFAFLSLGFDTSIFSGLKKQQNIWWLDDKTSS